MPKKRLSTEELELAHKEEERKATIRARYGPVDGSEPNPEIEEQYKKFQKKKAKKEKVDKTLYTEDSIISLNPREFTRLRPSTYLGSNEYSTQLVREVFANALDEHLIGHGTEISVYVATKENTYKVVDHGQGFPVNVVKDGETILQASFDRLNTSGKYDEDGVYGGSVLGLNGIGAKLTNFLSKWLIVTTLRDGQVETIKFIDGVFNNRDLAKKANITDDEPSGTAVSWQPDPQFFQHSEANLNDLRKLFEDIAALCPALTIEFKVDDTIEKFHADNGIQSLLDKKAHKELLSNRFVVRKISGDNLFDIAMTYTSDYSDSITAYVNYGLTESGAHISYVRSIFTAQVNKYAYDNGLLNKKDEKLTSAELSEGQVLVFNVKANNVKYDSQTKVRVVDLDASLIQQVMKNDFADWLNNNPKDAKLIIDRALIARKAKEAAQKAKDGIRNASGKKAKKFIDLPTKLVDAYSKDRSKCELFITEGDSAANGIKAKRDGETQAVFPIRGKILSCRKASLDKIYANQEISNIVKAIGLDIEKDTGKLIYDAKKLRYDKIVLATDADSDGFDIKLLLINMFWWLCPELLENGHIYVAIPPLYRITTKSNDYIYLIDDKALNKYKKENKGNIIINRMKGLGEMDAKELAYCLVRPDSRNIKQIVVDDSKLTDELLEITMGNDVPPRRDYLLKHQGEVVVDFE